MRFLRAQATLIVMALFTSLLATGSIAVTPDGPEFSYSNPIPQMYSQGFVRDTNTPWWERTGQDMDRDGIADALQKADDSGPRDIVVVFERQVTEADAYGLLYNGFVTSGFYPNLNLITLRQVPRMLFPGLLERDGVAFLEPMTRVEFFSNIATPAARARESLEYSPDTAWDLGVSGKGAVVAIMDTGIDGGHPAFAGKHVGGVDFTKGDNILFNLIQPKDGTGDPDDCNGHGTTCAGIATGTGAPEGVYMGAAPDAKLADLRIGTCFGFSPGEGPIPDAVDAALRSMEWALANKDIAWQGQSEEYHGIDIISLSWGVPFEGSTAGDDSFSQSLDRLSNAGVINVVAVGNEGPDNDGMTGMSAASTVITVGATDDRDTVLRDDDIIADYSTRGPRDDNGDGYPYDELKPDVTAPGTGITQAEYNRLGDADGNGYGSRGSGTSYATPLVAGVVALMLEANGNLTPDVTKEILRFTSERRGDATYPELDPFWNREFGWGMVDAYDAVKVAMRTEDVEAVDVELQNFLTNVTAANGKLTADGVSWARVGEIETVEVRIDDGEWVEVTPIGDDDANPYSLWTYTRSQAGLSAGNHTIQARAVNGDYVSLYDEVTFSSEGATGGQTSNMALAIGLNIVMALLIGYAVFTRVFKKKIPGFGRQAPLEVVEVEEIGS